MKNYEVRAAVKDDYEWMLLLCHYARRLPSISHAYGLFDGEMAIGIITFGTPASRHLQISACRTRPSCVLELNRLFVVDHAAHNTESWFLSRALKLLKASIVVSYADTLEGHDGCVYRASNFKYAGWTDMDRKSARFDYVVPGRHSRSAYRGGVSHHVSRVQRSPKIKYWTITGNRKEQHELQKICTWPSISWVDYPPPKNHVYQPIGN